MLRSGQQLVAARSLLSWTQTDLAEHSKVAVSTIKRLEGKGAQLAANPSTLEAIERALTVGGVVLLEPGDTTDGGYGVRLRERG